MMRGPEYEAINYGLQDDDGRGDTRRLALLKLEHNDEKMREYIEALERRIEWLEGKVKIHIRG